MLRYIKFAQVPVSDQDRALAFYTEKVGFTVVTDVPYSEGGGRWIELAIEGADTRALFTERPDTGESDQPVLNLVVDDVQASAAELRARGVVFIDGPKEAPWAPGEWYATFRDSEGNMILIGNG